MNLYVKKLEACEETYDLEYVSPVKSIWLRLKGVEKPKML